MTSPRVSRVAALLLLLAATSAVVTAKLPEEDGVLVLTEDNFEEALAAHPKMLVEFYAPWCGHCKKLAPEYAAAASALEVGGVTEARLAKVDATANSQLASKYDVSSYPTLKWFADGASPIAYTGGRVKNDLVGWVRRKLGQVVVPIQKAKQLRQLKREFEVLAVGFFRSSAESDESAALEAAAKAHTGIGWASSAKKRVGKEAGVSEPPALLLFRDWEDEPLVYEGAWESGAIVSWVKDNQNPLVIEFTQAFAQTAFTSGPQTHMGVFVDKRAAYFPKLKEAMARVAAENTERMLAVFTDIEHSSVHDHFKVDRASLPHLMMLQKKGSGVTQFHHDGDVVDEDSMREFVNSFFDGTLKPKLRSEPIPKRQDGPVHVLVGDSFKADVLDSGRDALVEFYAPWCGHCKKLAPVYDELAENFASVDSVLIAKMDGTANDVDKITINGYPTIYFFPAGGEPKLYNGGRSLEALTSYIVDNAGSMTDADRDAVSGGGAAAAAGEPATSAIADDGSEEGLDDEDDDDDDSTGIGGSLVDNKRKLTEEELAEKYRKEDGVIILNDNNVADAIADHEWLLLEFYAPWCGHCQRLEPEYIEAAKQLSDMGNVAKLAKVDATQATSSAAEHDVDSYPTIKLFHDGKLTGTYSGGRSRADLVRYVKDAMGAVYDVVSDVATLRKLLKSEGVIALGLFDDLSSSDAGAFKAAAKQIDTTVFAISDAAELFEEYDAKSPAILVLKNFDSGREDFTGPPRSSGIADFVRKHSIPTVFEFDPSFASRAFNYGPTKHLIMFVDKNADYFSDSYDLLHSMGSKYRNKMLAVYVDVSYPHILKHFEIDAGKLPAALIMEKVGANVRHYPFDEIVTADNLPKFVADFHSGKAKADLKSEEPPASQDGPVVTVVGKTFEDIVMDEDKDVMLEFYAPWCGHCKNLAPTWERLAEEFADVDSVVIAKIDATANDVDHDEVKVSGFPTIMFFPAHHKDSPTVYSGGRDLDTLEKWINANVDIEYFFADDDEEDEDDDEDYDDEDDDDDEEFGAGDDDSSAHDADEGLCTMEPDGSAGSCGDDGEAEDDADAEQHVRDWLQLLGMQRYADSLIDEGYDRLDVLLDASDADLKEAGVKGGHRKLMLRENGRYKQQGDSYKPPAAGSTKAPRN